MQEIDTSHRSYKYRAWTVFGLSAAILFYRVVARADLSDMFKPPFLFHQTEIVYKLLHASRLPWLIASIDFLFTYFFYFFILMMAISFMRTSKRAYAISFTIGALLYFLIFNMVTGHHYHALAGIVIISFPFWFKREDRFNLAWEGVRYYWLYIFSSAALWKILRGSAFYTEQLSNTLKSQQLDLLLSNPDSLQAQSVQYLIAHPQVSHMVLLVNVALQLSFAVGFFTKRFDTVLFWLAIVFCVANYFVMNIVSVELLILNLALINFEGLKLKVKD